MYLFSHLLYFCSIIYLVMGVVMLCMDKKAALNRAFFALNLCLALWSLCLSVSTSSPDKAGCILWNTIAALGYCTFASISLHFFLIYTKKDNLLKKWWTYIALYLPAAIFIVQAIKRDLYASDFYYNKYGWISIPQTDSIWYLIFILFIAVSGTINIYLCYSMLRKSTSARERKQTRIIFITNIISFLFCMGINLFTKNIVNLAIPDITVTGLMIWLFGILFAIIKYRLMILSPSIAAESILKTIIDSVVLVNPNGLITYVNSETLYLLHYEGPDLLGKPFEILFPKDIQPEIAGIVKSLGQASIRNKDTFFISENNTRIPILFSASVCNDNEGDYIGFVAFSRDITQLKTAEERIKHLALHDALTNLPNRIFLGDWINHEMGIAQRNNTFIAYILLDLDRFKEINDVFGHNMGDLLLIEVANRLAAVIRESDMIARLGGDEFVVLQSDLKNVNDYETTIRRILKCLSEPFFIESHELNITASAGISIYPINAISSESLLKCADLAMYSAKNQGKNNYKLYDDAMSTAINKRAALEERLNKSIINNELFLHYQPIIDMQTGGVIGVEALVRWKHDELGVILPEEFIPIAEANGFIFEIGEWVLRTACFQAKTWQREGLKPVYIAVNLSARQFYPPNLIDVISGVLKETELDPEYLMLEITESTAVHNLESSLSILTQLHNLNIKVSIDDFGTGYSSLLYLKTFPVYAIKIDKCFTKDIANNSEYVALVAAIIAMAHSVNIKVIAEGIEDKAQMDTLQTLKQEYVGSPICDEGQGFLFSKPVSENMIATLLKNKILPQ